MVRRPARARRAPARLAGAAAPPKRSKTKKKASGTAPAADKILPPKASPMAEVPLEAVKVPVSGGIVDRLILPTHHPFTTIFT